MPSRLASSNDLTPETPATMPLQSPETPALLPWRADLSPGPPVVLPAVGRSCKTRRGSCARH
ncbi:hypothetical protein EMPG_11843 [Blastomyces silverae]|uniref:Uncharacterized protein n=1 Tax=Blastomyces silverae TaxID=2060906 RepID=A0A0H1BP92_9EURO|nr:hypothetical protein EMPG_11843 [Blastomyces silverae]